LAERGEAVAECQVMEGLLYSRPVQSQFDFFVPYALIIRTAGVGIGLIDINRSSANPPAVDNGLNGDSQDQGCSSHGVLASTPYN